MACPAASDAVNWISVELVAPSGSPSRAASLFWLSSSAPEPASPALARSRKNMPNRGPLVPPTASQDMYMAVTQSRWEEGAASTGWAVSGFMADVRVGYERPAPGLSAHA